MSRRDTFLMIHCLHMEHAICCFVLDVNCRLTRARHERRNIFLEGRTMVPMDGTAAKRFCDKLAAVNPLGSVVANGERKEVRI